MKSIEYIATPTADLKVTKVRIDFSDFDPHVGLSFRVLLLNESGSVIDVKQGVQMKDSDWQNWGPSPNEIDDIIYVANAVAHSVGIPLVELVVDKSPTL